MWYRPLLVSALLLSGLTAMAQADGLRSFESTTALDRTALKIVTQAITDLDPMAKVFHSDDMRILQVRANAQVTDGEVRSAIQTSGVQLREGTPDLTSYLPAPDANTPPIYVVTGNETEDLARYQAAVTMWNQAHPDRAVSQQPLHLNVR